MLFVFLLTIWSSDAPPEVYVMGHSLTAEECTTRMKTYLETYPYFSHGVPSCEFDMGDDF